MCSTANSLRAETGRRTAAPAVVRRLHVSRAMTLELWSSPNIHLARVDGDIVILDAETDCYHCLLDGALWLTTQTDGRVLVTDEEAARELEAAGFCSRARSIQVRCPFVAPRRELPPSDRPSRRETAAAAVSLFRATLAFRGQPLIRLIEPLAPNGASAASPEEHLALSIAAARSAMPWVPFEGECLQRAFQLRRLLAERGMSVTWMFGVRTWPFAAHCWLQSDDLVVGDTVERVSRYVPIMAI